MTARRPISRRHAEIPVSVRVERGRKARPAQTTVPPSIPKARTVKPRPRRPAVPTNGGRIHSLPIEQRKRLMWGIVAGGMLVVLIGWALTLGHELRQTNREPNLITQLTDVFRSFQLPKKTLTPAEQEVRNLEKQVFPQF